MQDKIVGRNSVLELLRRGNREIERILIAQGNNHPRLRQIRAIAEKNGIRCDFTPRRELDPIETDVPHQGVIALVSPASYIDLPSLITNTQSSNRPPLFIMLDQVQDPRNLGAIIRTADAVNADGLILRRIELLASRPLHTKPRQVALSMCQLLK